MPVRKTSSETRTSVVRELHPRSAGRAPGMTDAVLVSEIRSGSTAAAGMFFDRYGGSV